MNCQNPVKKAAPGLAAWAICVLGWLLCAGLCLALTLLLEAWPAAYDLFLPAVLLILFGNILVFLFVATRLAGNPGKLIGAVFRVCLGEGLILALFYVLGIFLVGS